VSKVKEEEPVGTCVVEVAKREPAAQMDRGLRTPASKCHFWIQNICTSPPDNINKPHIFVLFCFIAIACFSSLMCLL
jgi:hypothetical protein